MSRAPGPPKTLKITARFEGPQVAQVISWSRQAGLADGRGEGVSTLAREATVRYGGLVSRELRAERAAKAPGSVPPGSAPSRRDGGVRDGGDVSPPAGSFRCPRGCDPSWRPLSSGARCPFCRSRVVPEGVTPPQ